ncbi:uncharacterized protein LOC135837612 isoform X2 [Planococcus citri]
MTANDNDWLSGNIDKVSNRLIDDGMEFTMIKKFYSSYYPDEDEDESLNSTDLTVLPFEILLNTLQESPSYSVIFVVTNANATKPSNETKTSTDLILEEIQNKRTQVNFLIGTEAPFLDNDSLQEFRLIASISNGFVLGPEIFQFDKFTDAIYLRLTHQPQEILLFSLQDSKSDVSFCSHAEPFFTNALKDFKFSNCSSKERERKLGNPRRSTLTNLIEKSDDGLTIHQYKQALSKTCSFKKPIYSVWFDYKGFTGNDYDFDYGFTIEDVDSLDNTYRRPMSGMTNKIYVSLTDENFEHGVDHFKILFLNQTQFGENIAVEQIPETDLFVGSFDPPKKEYFYVEVTSYVNEETTVSRISSTAVNAAEGFGDDHGNQIFEHRPIFKRQPVSIESYDIYDYIDTVYFSICVLLGVLLLIVVFDLALNLFTPDPSTTSRCTCFLQLTCCTRPEQGKNPQQRSKNDKDCYRAVPTVDRV